MKRRDFLKSSALDGNFLISNDRFSGVLVRDGRLILPDRPGIGVEEI